MDLFYSKMKEYNVPWEHVRTCLLAAEEIIANENARPQNDEEAVWFWEWFQDSLLGSEGDPGIECILCMKQLKTGQNHHSS
jgi:hypothetical protein